MSGAVVAFDFPQSVITNTGYLECSGLLLISRKGIRNLFFCLIQDYDVSFTDLSSFREQISWSKLESQYGEVLQFSRNEIIDESDS